MGSAGFLIIFGLVNVAEARTARSRGSAPWVSALAAAVCVGALAALVVMSTLGAIAVLVVMVALAFVVEAIFRRASGRPVRV